MDSTASSLCMDNDIPLIVFSITEKGNIKRAVTRRKHWNNCKGEINMPKQVLQTQKKEWKKQFNHYSRELASIRAGRASASFLDRVTVEYYGAPTPINQMAELQRA